MRRLALILIILVCQQLLASDGAEPTCVGTKGPVSLPIDGDAQSAFRMPSSIAWGDKDRIDLDAFLFVPMTTVRNATNDFSQTSLGGGGTGGFIVSLPGTGMEDLAPSDPAPDPVFGRIQLHMGEYVEVGGASGVSKLSSLTYPYGRNTETGLSLHTTAFTVAYAPVDWLGFGASFHFIYGQLKAKSIIGGGTAPLNGSPHINGVPIPGNPTYTDFLNLFQTGQLGDPATYVNTSNMTSFQVSGEIALSIRPWKNLGFGISYEPRSLILQDFQGTALVDARQTVALAINPLAPPIQNLFLATLPDGGRNGYLSQFKIKVKGIHTPETVRLSAAWWITDRILVAGEVAWYEWTRALAPVATLSGGNNRDLNFMIGNPSVVTSVKVGWSNEWVWSLYSSFGVTDDLAVRLGFNYGGMPVNADYLGDGPNSAIVSMTLTAGVGYKILPGLEVSVMCEYSPYCSIHSDGLPQSVSSRYANYSARQFLAHLGVGYEF